MSVSLWRYNPDKCDSSVCRGDCDLCGFETESEEEEESPIITKASPASLGIYKKEDNND